MKKLLLTAVALAVCLSVLSGCYSGHTDTSESQPETDIAAFDCYYNLSTAKGLELYVWKINDSEYRCGLMPGTNRTKTPDEIVALPPATATEMQVILSSYAIADESITVIPIIHPRDSHPWVLNDAEAQNLRDMFGFSNVIDTVHGYESESGGFYDSICADIDNDGTTETCTLGYGWTSGLFTFSFTASADGVTKYSNTYCTEWYDLSFAELDGRVYVQGITQGTAPETHLFSISVEAGNVVLSENGEPLADMRLPDLQD